MTLSSMYLSSFVVSSPFFAAIDLTGRGGTTLWLPAAVAATLMPAAMVATVVLTVVVPMPMVVVMVVVAAVVMIAELLTADVLDAATIGWTACRQGQLLLATEFGGHALVSSAKELILRCEPPQLLPHEIFTEQLILS